MSASRSAVAAVVVVALSGCGGKQEQRPPPEWRQEVQLFGEAGATHTAFGQVLALSGGVLAVAENGLGDGAVYLFRQGPGGWRREARLTHPDGLRDVGFGFSLAVAGDTLLVGVPGDGNGAAYVFTGGGLGWSLQARLVAPAAASWFGRAVALRGDLAVVGAPTDGGTGAAYVYVREAGSWALAARLTGGDTGRGDFFGGALALDEGALAVGAELHADAGPGGALLPRRGGAYVFALQGGAFVEEAELCACDAAAWDYLGVTVALSGGTLVAGNARQHAAAHVFARGPGGWTEEAELRAADAAQPSGFGHQVAASGDWVVVGAPFGDRPGVPAAGEAWAFRRTAAGWEQVKLLDTDDPGAHFDAFGDAVAIDGDTIAVGASADDENGVDLGAVYVYRLR